MAAPIERVPFLDLRASYLELQSEIDQAVLASLRSGWYIGGEEVEQFEAAFATYTESAHCASVGNGLDALVLSLRAVGIGPGDEVLVPAHTFIATWLAVTAVGAVPVPVDQEVGQFLMSPERLESAITPRCRAVVPVHLYGMPADLDAILQIARARDMYVIEDAAQAHGARYRGRRIGGHGHAVAWSFYPGKNLGAFGDAGAVTTDDPDIASNVRMLRNYGSQKKYVNQLLGTNSRLDPIQAAVLQVKLRYLDEWNERRRHIAQSYLQGMADNNLRLPQAPDWAEPVWHLFVVQSEQRTGLQEHLHDSGVGSLIHYPVPPHLQLCYSDMGFGIGDFPNAERLAREVLSLPIGPHLQMGSVEYVVDVMNYYCRNRANL